MVDLVFQSLEQSLGQPNDLVLSLRFNLAEPLDLSLERLLRLRRHHLLVLPQCGDLFAQKKGVFAKDCLLVPQEAQFFTADLQMLADSGKLLLLLVKDCFDTLLLFVL